MQPAQMTMMQQQQSAAAAAAAAQQGGRPMQAGGVQSGSEFVRMELRQSLQAKQQLAGRKLLFADSAPHAPLRITVSH